MIIAIIIFIPEFATWMDNYIRYIFYSYLLLLNFLFASEYP